MGPDVDLNFVGPVPQEIAERACGRGHVYVPYMSFELLGPPKIFASGAERTGMPFLAASCSTTSLVYCGALNS